VIRFLYILVGIINNKLVSVRDGINFTKVQGLELELQEIVPYLVCIIGAVLDRVYIYAGEGTLARSEY
jgi:hypothetical protein